MSKTKKTRKLKRFTKEQLEAINNAPMFVKKREQAEAFFASPGYKAIAKNKTEKKAALKKSPKALTKRTTQKSNLK